MRFYKGLRFKLTALYSGMMLLLLAAFSVYQYVKLWADMLEAVDNRLRDKYADFVQEQSSVTPEVMREYAEFITAQNRMVPLQPTLFVQFTDLSGAILARSDNAPQSGPLATHEALARLSKVAEVTETVSGRFEVPIRVFCTRIRIASGDEAIFQLGVSLRRQITVANAFAQNLAIASFLFVLLSAFAGWLLARRALQPVHDVIETARAITAERLHERLTPAGSGDEIDELIHTLNDMIARLEAAFHQISQFTADVSHELRTPLAVIKGEIEVALEYGKSLEDLRGVLESTLEEINNLTNIANDLLLLARADARIQTERFEEIKLRHLLSEVASAGQVLAEGNGIRFTMGPIDEAIVLGSHQGLQRVFMNLLDNAAKYTPSGGEIYMSCRVRDGVATVIVRDTGVGIAPEDLPHIFNRFYKASRSRSSSTDKGAGLGLSICKAVVEQHGGTISVDSMPEKGTTVTVLLPVLKAA